MYLALLLLALLGFGCGDDSDGAPDPCDGLCGYEATCFSPCDPDEGPDCDPEERYDRIFAECTSECQAGMRERPECPSAAEGYAGCTEGRACGAADLDACAEDSRRYEELCVSRPGALVCPSFCAELEVGCTPYEYFGVRGPGCTESCESATEDLECLEALYQFDFCSPGTGYACEPLAGSCDEAVSLVQTHCEGLQPVTPDPDEESFCADVAGEQCRCALWTSPDCAVLASNRCQFNLGFGEDCRGATVAFDACMRALPECDRDALRDACLDEWTAYDAACDVPK